MSLAAMLIGIGSLVFAIIGALVSASSFGASAVILLICLIASIVGIIISANAMKKVPEKKGMAVAGLVTSIIAVVYSVLSLLMCVACGSVIDTATKSSNESTSESTTTTDTKSDSQSTFGLGETWTVNGQWKLTIDSVTTTADRNQYSDKTPEQVVIVTYTYENIGYDSKSLDGLWFGMDPGGDCSVVDATGEIGYSYPGQVTTHPQRIPIGATCTGAQSCIGLAHASDSITITVKQYDSNSKKQTATFKVPVN